MLHAVIVGIDTYEEDAGIQSLSYAAADARRLGELITSRIEPSEQNVRVLLNEAATRQNILEAIGVALPQVVGPDDIVLLYFAGHGSAETLGGPDDVSRYLVPYDSPRELVYVRAIDIERELVVWRSRLVMARLVVALFDACFTGSSGARGFVGPRLREIQRGQRNPRISLKELEVGEGWVVLSACGDHEVAREDHALRHGVFTYYLLQTLTRRVPGKSTISLGSLYADVSEAVHEHTGGRQNPMLSGDLKLARLPLLA